MVECSPQVLATVVDFVYGIGIPEDCSNEDAKSLLAMADLYLMEDLKDAVGSLIATKHRPNRQTILELSELAEKFSNKKLKEICCQFVFQHLGILDKKLLTLLCEVLPVLREKALLELQRAKGRPNNVEIAEKVFGVKLTSFKEKVEFKYGFKGEYKGYVMARIEPNMLVLYKRSYDEDEEYVYENRDVPNGTIGRVISVDLKGATVKWARTPKALRVAFDNLELLTPPINNSFFKD